MFLSIFLHYINIFTYMIVYYLECSKPFIRAFIFIRINKNDLNFFTVHF